MTSRMRPLLLALAALIATPFAHAEKADRSKPVNIEADKVTPVIDKTYPLSETPAAFRYLVKVHARGKVVITVAE